MDRPTKPTRVLKLADEDVDLLGIQPLIGGEPRNGQLTGTRALMLAVLDDGVRSYLSGSVLEAQDASMDLLAPPLFALLVRDRLEMLGLDPDAVRRKLKHMKSASTAPRKALPRARHNVRAPGRVHPRKES